MPVGKVVKTKGKFCKKVIRSKGQFDRRSFRTVSPSKRTRITVACPKGKYKKGRCTVSMKTQRILKRKTRAGTCPRF